ncbi:MAG: UDP-2,4-diacetamido-2,4,6-trideoxy-beta-L-altropyranose hydrolase [Xanthomonadales bacterium]|nr:UDP-2,4-diacetamido-2,4,6-trideoxy-beta-L-altropyranose hydrolase [Xanthomonadales bacterium]
MKVVIRVDASLDIGTGHVMRCLTLANALRERGAECEFICREHAGHLAEKIESSGHSVHLLAPRDHLACESVRCADELAHASWLGCAWHQDAADTIAALGPASCDWLIVDHYALDARWEGQLRPHARKMLAIDDLADRPHQVDLLLDQNLGRVAADYQPYISSTTRCLVGPEYALLRPEFARLREYSLARRQQAPIQRIVVSLGGVDRDNITRRVLEALASMELPHEMKITVVMGGQSPWRETVQSQARHLPFSCQVLVDVEDMAQLMADTDLAIGAAGSSTWERCVLGLPSAIIVLAENQRAIAAALDRMGAALHVKHIEQVPVVIQQLRDKSFRQSVSRTASKITDGLGVTRLITAIGTMS